MSHNPTCQPAEAKTARPVWRRFLPLGILVVAIALAFGFGLDDYLSFEMLRDNHDRLVELVAANGITTAAGYILVYAVVVALSLPGATFLTLAGGIMFGALFAVGLSVTGATVGATIIFLIAKSAVGNFLYERAGPSIQRMEDGFRENALSYLLVLRLIPLFPFWLVNLVPAFLGVPLRTYVVGTFFGIIPGSFVYCLAGAGLGEIFATGAEFNINNILTPTMIAALAGLAILALLPIVYKRYRKTRG